MRFQESRSKDALLLRDRRLVRGAGFAGCPYWLIREKGSSEPVLPERWSEPVKEWEGVQALVRKAQRGIKYAVLIDLGQLQRFKEGRQVRRVHRLSGGPFPFAVNAQFIAHVERCHDRGIWMLLAEGQLLYVQTDRSGRYYLQAIVMGIADPGLPS